MQSTDFIDKGTFYESPAKSGVMTGDLVMRHCGTQLLETDRLILRRFETGDAEAIRLEVFRQCI